MRFTEFKLTESVLRGSSSTSWPGYLRNMLSAGSLSLGDKGQKATGLVLTADSIEIIKGLEAEIRNVIAAKGNLEVIKSKIESTELSFTNGTTAPIKAVFKSPELRSGAADVATGARTTKYWNDGEVAETFLGVALFARFKSKKEITAEQVYAELKKLKSAPGGFMMKGKRGNNPVEMLAVNKPANNQAIEEIATDLTKFKKEYPDASTDLLKLIDASVSYVNQSSKVFEAMAKADNEPNADRIIIKTDGVSDQSGTKADLQLKVGDYERLLSLKANYVKQFGQDTGARFEVIKTFFGRFIPNVDISTLESQWPPMERDDLKNYRAQGIARDKFREVYNLVSQAYTTASDTVNSKLTSPASASQVVTDLYNGIIYHAQGSETKQVVVVLNPSAEKAWAELEFGESLATSLASFRLETKLTLAGQGDKDNHILQIFGRPLNSVAAVAMDTNITTDKQAAQALVVAKKRAPKVDPELLFQLRSYIQEAGPTLRNIVEMGPLLKDITEVQQIQNVANTSQSSTQEPQAAQQASTSTQATEPVDTATTSTATPAGVPSRTTSIAPMGTPTDQGNEADIDPTADKELERVKKNAGITVE
jgi:hypothetical protein